MFFSKLARILAIVAFVLGLLSALPGIYAATGLMGPDGLARYVGKSPERVTDRGIYTALFAVALGTLAEISFSMRTWAL